MDILDRLASLLDHSLLVAQSETAGIRRFVMLETIREYAHDRLEAAGELVVMRQRHAAYYLALAETAASELQEPHQAEWFARLEANHATITRRNGRTKHVDSAADAIRWLLQEVGRLSVAAAGT